MRITLDTQESNDGYARWEREDVALELVRRKKERKKKEKEERGKGEKGKGEKKKQV